MGEEAGSRMRRQDRTIPWRRSLTTNGIDGENFGGRRLEAKGGKKKKMKNAVPVTQKRKNQKGEEDKNENSRGNEEK